MSYTVYLLLPTIPKYLSIIILKILHVLLMPSLLRLVLHQNQCQRHLSASAQLQLWVEMHEASHESEARIATSE